MVKESFKFWNILRFFPEVSPPVAELCFLALAFILGEFCRRGKPRSAAVPKVIHRFENVC